MSYYGDSPRGMICITGWDYPSQLGVTEAGEGEDGRMKSAIGIGTLLMASGRSITSGDKNKKDFVISITVTQAEVGSSRTPLILQGSIEYHKKKSKFNRGAFRDLHVFCCVWLKQVASWN